MRKSLFSAAAVAPLLLLAAYGSALADPTTIDDDLTNPVHTSDYVSGAAADLILSSQGSIKLSSGVGVTIDSSNTFANNGSINIDAGSADNSNNATGVLILGGHTGSFDNKGTISVTEDYDATDTNGDGVIDGPWAKGSGRYGVRVIGPGAFTGDIFNEGGTITVEGNNSFGISVETQLIGNLKSSGTINVTGDNSAAIQETAGVVGNIQLTGPITVNGAGAKGVDLSGDVDGTLSIYNSISVSGYRINQRPQDPDVIAGLDPSDLQQGGPAVDVRASVTHGIYVGAAPAGTTTDTGDTVDLDGDGIPDKTEGTGSITVLGGAPALKIGDTGKDIDIGVFGTGANNFGLIVRGNVTSNGLFDDVSSTAIQIGADGGGTTTVEGGIRALGTISASSHEADATGIHILAGGNVANLQMEGSLESTVVTAGDDQSTGILIDAGANVSHFANIGVFSIVGGGNGASAYGVQDKSGTLDTVLNKGTISTSVRPSEAGGAVTGRKVAFDLSANTSGISFTQAQNTDAPDSRPLIAGDVLLGTGDDTVQLLAGTVLGALDFNAGGGSLTINNATYSGALTASGNLSSVSVTAGTLIDISPTTINTGSLSVDGTSLLVVSADPLHSTSTRFNVSGAADLASGSKLGLNLLSLPSGTQTFTVIDAGTLTSGNADSALLTQTPYLVVADAHTDTANGTLTIDVRRRTAEEAGFNRAEASAYDSVYADLNTDAGIQHAFLAQQTQQGLLGLYDQMLPDHAGGVLRAIQWATEAAQDAAAHSPEGDSASNGPTRGWTEEIGFSENKERIDASAYRILGVGAVAGLESVSPNGNAIGADISFMTANVSNPDTPGDDLVGVQQVGLGVYWRGSFGGLHVDAQAGGGYMWANGRREFIFADAAGVVHRQTESSWNGYSVFGRMGAYYDFTTGNFYLRPSVHADYIRLHEAGYTEVGGGNGFDLAVDGRTGDALSGTASLIFGYTFGDDVKWRPEIEVGYRGVIAGSGGDTTAAFVGGGGPFNLPAEALRGGGPIARFGIHAYGKFVDLKIDAGGEFRDGYTDLDIRMMVRIVF